MVQSLSKSTLLFSFFLISCLSLVSKCDEGRYVVVVVADRSIFTTYEVIAIWVFCRGVGSVVVSWPAAVVPVVNEYLQIFTSSLSYITLQKF